MARTKAVLRRGVTATAMETSAVEQINKGVNAIVLGQQLKRVARGKKRQKRLGQVVKRQAGARFQLGARLAVAKDKLDTQLLRVQQRNAALQKEANARMARHQQTVEAAKTKLNNAEYTAAMTARQGRYKTNVGEARAQAMASQANFVANAKRETQNFQLLAYEWKRRGAKIKRNWEWKRQLYARRKRNLKRKLQEQQTVLTENLQNIKANAQNRTRNKQFQRQLNAAGAKAQQVNAKYTTAKAQLEMQAFPIRAQARAWAGNGVLKSNVVAAGRNTLQKNTRPASNFKSSWPQGGNISKRMQV